MVDELAEHQHLVAVFQQARQQLGKRRQLAAGQAQFRRHQLRVAAGAAQLHDLGQDLDGFFRRRPFHHRQLFQRFAAQRLVQRGFLRRQLHFQHDLRARRQFRQHLRLGAAQDEGCDQAPQPQTGAGGGALVLVFFDRAGKAQVELVQRAQQTGVDEAEQIPQFAEVVFQRRAAGHHAKVALQRHHRLRALGGAILDRLRFVEHDGMPAHAGKQRRFLLQQAIAGHHQVERLQLVEHVGAVAAAEQFQLQGRREALRFGQPVHAHRRGRHHQGRAVRRARQYQRQRLQRLAEAHVVGQAGAHAPVGQARQPLEAGQLVVAQVGLQGARQLRREVVQRAQAQQVLAPQFVGLDAAGVIGQLFQRKRGQRMDVHAVVVHLAIGGQFRQAPVQFVARAPGTGCRPAPRSGSCCSASGRAGRAGPSPCLRRSALRRWRQTSPCRS